MKTKFLLLISGIVLFLYATQNLYHHNHFRHKEYNLHQGILFFLSSIFIVLNDLSVAYTYKTYISIGLKILLIASITQAIARLIEGVFRLWTEKRGGGFPSTTIFTNIVSITIYTIGLLIVLDALNISIAPMLTALGVGGLAVSLALKDTLSDVFAGLHILLSKKVQKQNWTSPVLICNCLKFGKLRMLGEHYLNH